MKAINKKNKKEFIDDLNRAIEKYGFVLSYDIENWLQSNGKDYFINREKNCWEENEEED